MKLLICISLTLVTLVLCDPKSQGQHRSRHLSASLNDMEGLADDLITLPGPPGYTLLPPDWNDDANVNIPPLGTIQGGANISFPLLTGRKFLFFAGIPYADPASYTGENRFKPSKIWDRPLEPVDDDTGEFQATDFSVKCPQSGIIRDGMDFADVFKASRGQGSENPASGGIIQDQREDCLVLNVNTPGIPTGAKKAGLPVIVFLHGDGGWSGQYRGHYFLKKDVVLVTVNYRVGLLGSLNLGINDAPGNAALYDVVTALKWIKTYISHFGGDPDKVTLSGHSAGAVLATHFLTSELAIDGGKPLVHGIIGLSGSSLSTSLATCTDPLTHHLRASQFAGCYDGTSEPDYQAIRTCMKDKSTSELLDAMNKYTAAEIAKGRFGLEAKIPSLQLSSVTDPRFIREIPYKVLEAGTQNNIPVMMGVTRHDGSFLVERALEQYWRPNNFTNDPILLRNHLLPTLLEALDLQDSSGEFVHSLVQMFIGEAMYLDDFESKIPGLIDIYSVLAFKAGAYNLVELHSRLNPDSYYFSFEHASLCSDSNGQAIPGGVGHADSLFFLFPSTDCILLLPADLTVSSQLIDRWVNFATFGGNPNGVSKRKTAPAYNELNHGYLVIDGSDSWTNYYCRDSWIGNSLELMKEPPAPTDSNTGTTPTDSNTGTTSTGNSPTTGGDKSSDAFTLTYSLLPIFISYVLRHVLV